MLMLVRYIKAQCPQQAIDVATPAAWYEIIGDLDYETARNAVRAVVRQQPFVSPSAIIAETERRPHAHPSDRTVAEALAASSLRELPAAQAVPPNAEYLAAREKLNETMRIKAEQALA